MGLQRPADLYGDISILVKATIPDIPHQLFAVGVSGIDQPQDGAGIGRGDEGYFLRDGEAHDSVVLGVKVLDGEYIVGYGVAGAYGTGGVLVDMSGG